MTQPKFEIGVMVSVPANVGVVGTRYIRGKVLDRMWDDREKRWCYAINDPTLTYDRFAFEEDILLNVAEVP